MRRIIPVLMIVAIALIALPAVADNQDQVIEGNPTCADIGETSLAKDDNPPDDKVLNSIAFDYVDETTVNVFPVGDVWEVTAVIVKAGPTAHLYLGAPFLNMHGEDGGNGFRNVSHVEVCGIPKETTTTTKAPATTTTTVADTTTSTTEPDNTTTTVTVPESTTTTTIPTSDESTTTTATEATVPTVPDGDDSSQRTPTSLPDTGLEAWAIALVGLVFVVGGWRFLVEGSA